MAGWLTRPLSEVIGLRPGRTARLRARADSCRRARLIAGILTPACPVCAATAGTGCNPYSTRGAEVVRLDRDPLLFAHSDRLTRAISLGFAPAKLVLAQFMVGVLPAGLRKDA